MEKFQGTMVTLNFTLQYEHLGVNCRWVFGFLGWTYAMPYLVSLTFGALISATDPVTVLAIFNVITYFNIIRRLNSYKYSCILII